MAADRIEPTADLTTYPAWDLACPPIPPRSVLYRVPPIGLGTPDVESLTGYLARLAEAHGVSTRTLMVQAVLPLGGRTHLTRPIDNSLSAFWARVAHCFNGTGRLARDGVQAVAQLTGQPDLAALTCLPGRDVLPPLGLLRPSRAWCPVCYQGWRDAGQVVYEPLRWALAVITICPHHRRPLRSICPHPTCRRSLAPLAPHSRPGHCSHCGGWLGASAEPDAPAAPEQQDESAELVAWQAWVGEAVGAWLAQAGRLTEPPGRARIPRLIARCADQAGSTAAFAHALHLSGGTVAQWQHGRHLPQLATLLMLAYRLGLPFVDLLLGDPRHLDVRLKHPAPPRTTPAPPRATRHPFEPARIRRALEDALTQEGSPPPMRQVALRLGYSHADLHNRCPDLCRVISARYLAHRRALARQRTERLAAEVRQVTFQIQAQGVYPSSVRVASRLTSPSHFRHPVANAAWHAALRDLGWEP